MITIRRSQIKVKLHTYITTFVLQTWIRFECHYLQIFQLVTNGFESMDKNFADLAALIFDLPCNGKASVTFNCLLHKKRLLVLSLASSDPNKNILCSNITFTPYNVYQSRSLVDFANKMFIVQYIVSFLSAVFLIMYNMTGTFNIQLLVDVNPLNLFT